MDQMDPDAGLLMANGYDGSANGRDGSAQSGALGALGALRDTMAAADAELKRTLHELTERTRTLAAEMKTHALCRTELARQETELVQTRRSLADEARARADQETELHGTIESLQQQLEDWTAAMERTRSELLLELAATQRVPDTSGAGVAAAGPVEPSGTSEPSAAPAAPSGAVEDPAPAAPSGAVEAPAPAAPSGTVEAPVPAAPSGTVEAPVPAAPSGTEQAPAPSGPVELPARFVYTLTPHAGVAVTLCAVASDAGYDNSVGHYFADADGYPICGRIDFTNAKKSIGSSVTVNYAAEDLAGLAGLAGLAAAALWSVGLFIVPNGNALNADVPDNARVAFARNERDEWEARYNGEPVRGEGASALFSDGALNPDGSAHTTNDAGLVGFEDLSGFGGRSDNHYRDVVVDVRVADFAPAGEAVEAVEAVEAGEAGETDEAAEAAGAPQPSPTPPSSSAGEAVGAPQPLPTPPTTAGGDVSSGAPPTIAVTEVDGHIQVTVDGQAAPVTPNTGPDASERAGL
jgi:hypothetical protein